MGFDLGVLSAAVTLDDADYGKTLSGLEGSSEAALKKLRRLPYFRLAQSARSGGIAGKSPPAIGFFAHRNYIT